MMFTYTDKAASRMAGEALVDGGWVPFEPVDLFPTVWGSGTRTSRFMRKPHVMAIQAASVCLRHPGVPTQVKLLRESWEKQLGTLEPASRIFREELIVWTCGETVTLPDGRVLP